MGALDERLDLLYRLGGGAGANRIAGGDAETRACELVSEWLEEAGLEVERDAFGNVVGRLRGSRPELPEVWTGSHLDSVPDGGRYDGALGVVAAIEAVIAVGRAERTLGVVAVRGQGGGWHRGRQYTRLPRRLTAPATCFCNEHGSRRRRTRSVPPARPGSAAPGCSDRARRTRP